MASKALANISSALPTWAASLSELQPGSFRSVATLPRAGLLLATYALVCQLLRFRRKKQNETVLFDSAKQPLSAMTIQQAQKIFLSCAQLEFPTIFQTALQFALFRTYGIPTISQLLVKTSLFSSRPTAAKRYADTGVLVIQMTACDFGSPRWIESVARLNCIHGYYVDQGRISNDDMIYTISLFAREPREWTKRTEWRELTDVECCAIGVLWKSIGEAMLIRWEGFPGYESGEGWRDGLHWMAELDAWVEAYEKRSMLPHPDNVRTAEQTTALLLWTAPESLKPFGKQVIGALMDQRLRTAMEWPQPPRWVERFVWGGVYARRFVLRHFALPRPYFMRYHNVTDEPSPQGTYYLKRYENLPYYIKPTLMNRWGPGAWVSRMMGLPVPGDDGDKYRPQGYKTADVGPGHGKKGQKAMEATVEGRTHFTCPFGK